MPGVHSQINRRIEMQLDNNETHTHCTRYVYNLHFVLSDVDDCSSCMRLITACDEALAGSRV